MTDTDLQEIVRCSRMAVELRWAPFGGPEQAALVVLRREVLRKPLGLDYSPEQLALEASELHLGLWNGEKALGCLLLRDEGAGVVRMRQVAVSSKLQGNGLGRMLVAEAEAEARHRGWIRMILHSRPNAVRFYEKLGYRAEGELFEEIGIAHRLMAKNL
jgi:GNAT superfamily N-acetyltransferase